MNLKHFYFFKGHRKVMEKSWIGNGKVINGMERSWKSMVNLCMNPALSPDRADLFFYGCGRRITDASVPLSTRPPPTGGRRRGSCMAAAPRVSPGRRRSRGRCTPSCPGPARSSSSSAPDGTGSPRRTSGNIRSSCSPPTWNTRGVPLTYRLNDPPPPA